MAVLNALIPGQQDDAWLRYVRLVLLFALLVLSVVLGWITAAWRYWQRESLRARLLVRVALALSAGCLVLWVALGRRPLWLLLAGIALGPISVLIRMEVSWLGHQGPPETLQPLSSTLEMADDVLVIATEGVHKSLESREGREVARPSTDDDDDGDDEAEDRED